MKKHGNRYDISNLIEIMAALREPRGGCPWDLEQTFETIAPYTIEEAYEVVDAIRRGELDELRGELGDLLLQVVYHARMAEERNAFGFEDVVDGICEKMVRRHPHVFGEDRVEGAEAQTIAWEAHKARERARGGAGVLDGVALALPALTRAVKLGRRASRVGFDWPDRIGVREKVSEELRELDEALAADDRAAVAAEIGDILFSVANLCRHLNLDPEECLRGSNARFESRFRVVEQRVAAAGGWESFDAESLEQLWIEAKAEE
jgi:nucleoside triphosphate diphosphatase